MKIQLLRGDCLARMAELPAHSIDLILTDPPYGTTQCQWDSIIPLERMWTAVKRVIKPNGAIVLFAAQPFTSALVMSNPDWFKYEWCWKKPKGTGHLNAKKMPMRDKEDIVVFYHKPATYNPQFSAGKPYKSKAGKGVTECYGGYTSFRNDNEGQRYPRQVLEFGVVERGTVHPTQKPVDLLEYLIKTYTNPGDTVLDFTCGSGSTGVAAVNTDRAFIGIELDLHYFQIAHDRIKTACDIKNAESESFMRDLFDEAS